MVSERAEQCDPADDVFVRNHFVQQGIFRRLKQQIVTVAECGDLRRSASPSDSFRLRASTSIVRKFPTRSGANGRAMPCSAFSSSNSIWRMVLSVSEVIFSRSWW
jgi:hypothetical protein